MMSFMVFMFVVLDFMAKMIIEECVVDRAAPQWVTPRPGTRTVA